MTDPTPAETPRPDAYDQEEGYLVDIEDIAMVCHAALSAYREHCLEQHGKQEGWLHQPKGYRDDMVRTVQRLVTTPEEPADTPEARLVAGIVRALAVP